MERGLRCVMCPRSILRRRRHVLQAQLPLENPELTAYIAQNALIEVVFNDVMAVCHRCWQTAHNNAVLPEEHVADADENAEPENIPVVVPNEPQDIYVRDYVRAPNSSRSCMYRNCNNDDLRRLPSSLKVYLLSNYRVFVPSSARICREHSAAINFDDLGNVNVTNYFNSALISEMTNMLVEAVNNRPRFDFESNNLNDPELHFWTGLTLEQFNTILEETPSLAERDRQPRTTLGCYLTKIRTGESNERLATLFNQSRRTFERKLKLARECLEQDYVPRHLGLGQLSRMEGLGRNLLIPKGIFGNQENSKLILIADGTYIYVEKSSNFLFQRKSYSHHKFRNLVKPFLIVCSDGYILDVLGPYSATTSDATIMRQIMGDDEHMLHWVVHRGDVFILDRGFRDSIYDIESNGYEAHMPPTKNRDATQLSTEEANKSRLVTICRWVVEAVNGKFKNRFKLLRQTYFNRALPHMFADFRIAAAIINGNYRVASDNPLAADILNRINLLVHTPNLLQGYVQTKNLNRQRVNFVPMEVNMPHLEHFPLLNNDEMILFALGTYHIKLAMSYCAEHLRNGIYHIELYQDNNLNDLATYNITQNNAYLIRGRIQSRHVRARTHYCYVLIDRDSENMNAIAHWYCTCLTGSRTLGSCAHIISIIWYMGIGRHSEFNLPAELLNTVLLDEF